MGSDNGQCRGTAGVIRDQNAVISDDVFLGRLILKCVD